MSGTQLKASCCHYLLWEASHRRPGRTPPQDLRDPGPHLHVLQTETLGGRGTVCWKCLLLPEKLPGRLGTKLFSSIVNWPQDNFFINLLSWSSLLALADFSNDTSVC